MILSYGAFAALPQECLSMTKIEPNPKSSILAACPAMLGPPIFADIRWTERSPNCRKNQVRDRATAISFQRNGTDATNVSQKKGIFFIELQIYSKWKYNWDSIEFETLSINDCNCLEGKQQK